MCGWGCSCLSAWLDARPWGLSFSSPRLEPEAILPHSTVPDSCTSKRGFPCSSAWMDVPPRAPSSSSPWLEPPVALPPSNIQLHRILVHSLCIARHCKPLESPAGHYVDRRLSCEEKVFDGMYNLRERKQDWSRTTIDRAQKEILLVAVHVPYCHDSRSVLKDAWSKCCPSQLFWWVRRTEDFGCLPWSTRDPSGSS